MPSALMPVVAPALNRLASGGTAKYPKDFAYVGIGTGATAAATSDTTLGTESARALGTVSNPDSDTLRITYTFPAGTGTGLCFAVWQ